MLYWKGQGMEAIFELSRDDPYVRMTPKQRLAERKRRRENFFGACRPAPPPALVVVDGVDPKITRWIEANKATFANPQYHVMWFFDLIVLTTKPATTLPKRRFPRIEDIKRVVAKNCDVRMAEIDSTRRSADIVRPRQLAYLLCKEMTPFSLPQIGARFGGRDHTTILSGIRKIERLRKEDAALDEFINALKAELEASLA